MFDVGRVCLKVAGREAGKYCVVVKKLDANFVLVTGPRSVTHVKRRKCNILHLEPLKESLEIKDDASDEDVIRAYEHASLFTKLDLPKPSRRPEPAAGEKGPESREKPEKKKSKKKEAEQPG
jgi:large subunit ribosomal protein L14e